MLALIFLLVPILTMSLFRDRKDRYLLPMLAPAAVITARAVLEHFETRHTRNRADRAVVTAHWITLFVIAVGLPIAGAVAALNGSEVGRWPVLKAIIANAPTTLEGGAWYSPALAATAALLGGAIVAAGIALHRRRDVGIVATTVVLMIGIQALIVHGYRNSREGRSEMKPLAGVIWEMYPDAYVSAAPHRKAHTPPDLPIYLNRPIHRGVRQTDPPTTGPSASVQVMVARQDARDPEPSFPPPWQPITKVRRDNSWWHAFVLSPADPAPPTQPWPQR
jgi:hypothetical protein